MATAVGHWVHMVGIAGAGMSSIAKVLVEEGYRVSGSDLQSNSITKRLAEMGVEIYKGHSSSYVREGVDWLVISSAIPGNNPEIARAQEINIPILTRGQMLAKMVNKKNGIAVAGAHGKTTTTSMIYMCLAYCGLDPTFIVGGELRGSKLNACLGTGNFAVVEADESDASFLELNPYIAVITNIEDDHLDYYKSINNIHKAFKQYISQVKPEGFAVLYGEDEYNKIIKESTSTRVITYGESSSNDYYLSDWKPSGMGSNFQLNTSNNSNNYGLIELSVPGKHNAINALAAIAIALELGGNLEDIRRAIKDFKGTARRFEVVGKKNGITIVDDYAHHPTEIKVTIEAAQKVHDGRIIVVFQPHRYTRTKLLGSKIGESLLGADLIIVSEVYSAGEKAINGITGEIVAQAAEKAGGKTVYLPTFELIKNYLIANLQANDLVITMGAGDIWKLGQDLYKTL
jgi:UDP-N-acetylmuramate--alanine ligase